MKGGYFLGSLFFNLSCWIKFNLPFCCLNHLRSNRSNELEIASAYCDKRTVHLMHEITLILILMSFSAFVSFFWYYNYSVLNLRTLTHELIVNLH